MRQSCNASIARQLGIAEKHVEKAVGLLDDGGTVPFIARYRKEMTGSLDEVAISAIRDSLEQFRQLEKRKTAIVSSLEERNLLSEELKANITAASTRTMVEDLYLPYKQKRRTRAVLARAKGLESLADLIYENGGYAEAASRYISPELGVNSSDEALAGARDIVAERISENGKVRDYLRKIFRRESIVVSKVVAKKKEEAVKFSDYFDWYEPVTRIAGHRILALLRGEDLKYLRLAIRPDTAQTQELLKKFYINSVLRSGRTNAELDSALEDGYARLLAPSLENELRKELKERADGEAIEVFSQNLQELLLAPPLGQKRVLALDPGYRTGAKLVCLDEQGTLLHNETIYPTQGAQHMREAGDMLHRLVKRFAIEAVAVGNGTAGRETESFVRALGLDDSILITLVNEDGASIYSASAAARREFPREDITVRGAVSIGRRLQDPLAELVKIDPKSIGVGQYQHDVNQAELKRSLGEAVTRCVNSVGVEVNSASVELLSYVAGLGETLAANIVQWRQDNGVFAKRSDLLKVARLGAKAYEQCAGFLRIRDGKNPLDNTGVHPERYELVRQMARDAGAAPEDLLRSEATRQGIHLPKYCRGDVGMETLCDIMEELARPGRDPRAKFTTFCFDETVHTIEDLREGMILPAIITNVTKFGAFADIGVKQDGLIHISQMADRFVDDPGEIVRLRQQVRVKVLEIDSARKRIGLSLRLRKGE